jgi:hypothetical protein
MINLDFNIMPAIGINVMVIGNTSQMVKNIEGNSVFEFHVEENHFCFRWKHNFYSQFLVDAPTETMSP